MIPSYKKRFWKSAEVRPTERGFAVFLDDRQLTTPAKAELEVPTEGLAAEIVQEWLDQSGNVKPETMPATRMANSAIDLVSVQFDAVVDMVTEYGGSDLICYRADTPAGLVERQAAAWDPLVNWAETELGAPLIVTTGILPVAQAERSLERLRNTVADRHPFHLAALHDLVTLSGSLVVGLAVAANHLRPEEAWNVSRIDENWQAELWGTDEEAQETALIKENQFKFACHFLKLLHS
jgi:chaperone required for assembly of F1-ATPase